LPGHRYSWCLRLAWEGTAYIGWQAQARGPSIQQTCEKALEQLLGGEQVRLRAAGRTDAGVHALEQVVALRCRTPREARRLVGGLNRLLPADIACLSAVEMPMDFDPRTWTRRKTYRYRLLQRASPCPFRGRFSWHRIKPLEIDEMRIAAHALVGRHDFSSFRAAGCSAAHPMRSIESMDVIELDDEIQLQFTGDAFLRHQVRIMVGTLVGIGEGRGPGSSMASIRDACDRSAAGATAPAAGLSLVCVELGDGPNPKESS
jgi:tRNA pseudouridine38-40 synthase